MTRKPKPQPSPRKPKAAYFFEAVSDDRVVPIPWVDAHGDSPHVDGKRILSLRQAAKRAGRSRAELVAKWKNAWGGVLDVPQSDDEETWPGQVWHGRFALQPPRTGMFAITDQGRPDDVLAVTRYGPGDQSMRNALRLARRIARDPKHRSALAVNLRHVSMEGRPQPPWVYALQLRPVGRPKAPPIHPVPFCPYRFLFMLARHVRIPVGIGVGRTRWEKEFTGYDDFVVAQLRREFEPGQGMDEDRWTARGRKRRRELERAYEQRCRHTARGKGGRR